VLGNEEILLTVVDNLTGICSSIFLQMAIVYYWLQYMNPYS
jgi:hypothetical protein